MSNGLGGSNINSMQSATFGASTPMGWAILEEQPFMDENAGGRWTCGSGKAWGVMETGDDLGNRSCTACPPCTVDRAATRTMIRDGGMPCCNSEKPEGYKCSWPYQFAGNSTCPDGGPEQPMWQELYHVRRYAPQSIPISVPFNPFWL